MLVPGSFICSLNIPQVKHLAFLFVANKSNAFVTFFCEGVIGLFFMSSFYSIFAYFFYLFIFISILIACCCPKKTMHDSEQVAIVL